MTRWKAVFEAINPKNPEVDKWLTGISPDLYRRLQHQGDERRQARLLLVREVLEECTEALYGGWSRPMKDDSFVYVGRPTHDFKSLSIETPPPLGMVFLVFVLPDGTIDEWTWRKSDPESGAPLGVNGELIWPRQNLTC